MKIIKKILAKLGIIQLVWLEDHDGDITLSIKRKHPFGGYMAYRIYLTGRVVRLLPDGSTLGTDYVKRWMDYK